MLCVCCIPFVLHGAVLLRVQSGQPRTRSVSSRRVLSSPKERGAAFCAADPGDTTQDPRGPDLQPRVSQCFLRALFIAFLQCFVRLAGVWFSFGHVQEPCFLCGLGLGEGVREGKCRILRVCQMAQNTTNIAPTQAQHGRNIAPRWANIAPRWDNIGPRRAQHDRLNLGPRWPNIGPPWANIGPRWL